jgi:hypothetical protein
MIGRGREALRCRARSDRGAAATLVAVLLAGGVLLGMTALVVDVGQLYAEREELQSTADSTAMAVALDCALDRDACDEAQLPATATHYAEGNVRDNLAEVIICGSDERLPDCDDPQFEPRGNLTDCLGERPDGGIAYVEVRTSTLKAGGSTLLPPSFAQTLVSGHEGTTVGACARVAYGGPAVSLAVTISACEWDHATWDEDAEERDYADPDADLATLQEYEVVLQFLDPQVQKAEDWPDCESGSAGYDAPGGFGWLDDEEKTCSTDIEDDKYKADTGVNVSGICKEILDEAIAHATPLIFPVFKAVACCGSNTEYTLEALVAFVPTGYTMPGGGGHPQHESVLTGEEICANHQTCLSGYFIEEVESTGIGPLPGFGLTVVRTVG